MSVLPGLWSAFLLGAALGVTRPGSRARRWLPFVTGAAAGELLAGLLSGRWNEAAFCAAALAVLAWNKWNRKGKRAAKLVGAKSRAVLAAVVAKAREAGSSPVPEGARG